MATRADFSPEQCQALHTDATSAALAALTAKGAAADAEASRALLAGIGQMVANASTAGGFLGFGGKRVSEGERQFLAQLNAPAGTKVA